MNNEVATNGWVKKRENVLCNANWTHSRSPGGSLLPAAGSTRSSSVTGPPSTSSTGTNIESIMCATMCMLNMAGMYRPTPDEVAISKKPQPNSHEMVRPMGHSSPRCLRRRTPTTYAIAKTMAAVPKMRSKRQSNISRPGVGGPSRLYPMATSTGDGLRLTGGGGGVRPNPTAMPKVTAKMMASTPASRISGCRFSGSSSSAVIAERRCRYPSTPKSSSAVALPISSQP
ncbi:Uncharacterised protein [Mycobacteroides abscessus subsp. abscessus]|nr:Uncharacterised protein [Mycobacteroides abscessus subsp. abscessus]